MRGEQLRLEFCQKSFSLLLDHGSVGHRLGGGLRLGYRRSHDGRNSFLVTAGRTRIKIRGIVQPALGAWQSIAGRLVHRLARSRGTDLLTKISSHITLRWWYR